MGDVVFCFGVLAACCASAKLCVANAKPSESRLLVSPPPEHGGHSGREGKGKGGERGGWEGCDQGALTLLCRGGWTQRISPQRDIRQSSSLSPLLTGLYFWHDTVSFSMATP